MLVVVVVVVMLRPNTTFHRRLLLMYSSLVAFGRVLTKLQLQLRGELEEVIARVRG